jgi:hypothetical protein
MYAAPGLEEIELIYILPEQNDFTQGADQIIFITQHHLGT